MKMSRSVARPAAWHVREAITVVGNARCMMPYVLNAESPARFLSSPVMIALFIAAIVSAIEDEFLKKCVQKWAHFFNL